MSVANGSGATYRTKIPTVLIFQWTVSTVGAETRVRGERKEEETVTQRMCRGHSSRY